MSISFDEWESSGGDENEAKMDSMNAQELDQYKLGLLTSANDLIELLNKELTSATDFIELLNKEILQLKEEKIALQKKCLDLAIELVEHKRPKVREI